jgi:hypothetical protein
MLARLNYGKKAPQTLENPLRCFEPGEFMISLGDIRSKATDLSLSFGP